MNTVGNEYKISEIFYSIQGEGFWTGTACIFIRFFGCNLNCVYCDEKGRKKFSLLTSNRIFSTVKFYPGKRIILTGGEPLVQLSKNPEIIHILKKNGYHLHLETNGTIPLSCEFDWITVSPKTPEFISGNELKLIYNNQNLSDYEKHDFSYYFLQPKNFKKSINRKELKKVINLIKDRPNWRLSVQLHKFIKIK